MKLLILKKKIDKPINKKTGEPFTVISLFVKFYEKETYDNIVKHLQGKGATIEQVEKFCKPNEYNGKTSYAFGLKCSAFTFDKVETFGTLDCNVVFDINDSGFINAKIQVVDSKEKVNGYEASEAEVTGWTNGDNEPAKDKPNFGEMPPEDDTDDLPF